MQNFVTIKQSKIGQDGFSKLVLTPSSIKEGPNFIELNLELKNFQELKPLINLETDKFIVHANNNITSNTIRSFNWHKLTGYKYSIIKVALVLDII